MDLKFKLGKPLIFSELLYYNNVEGFEGSMANDNEFVFVYDKQKELFLDNNLAFIEHNNSCIFTTKEIVDNKLLVDNKDNILIYYISPDQLTYVITTDHPEFDFVGICSHDNLNVMIEQLKQDFNLLVPNYQVKFEIDKSKICHCSDSVDLMQRIYIKCMYTSEDIDDYATYYTISILFRPNMHVFV